MTLEIELRRVLSCEKFEHTNSWGILASKQVASIRELNVSTALDGDFFESLEFLREDVHHSYFVCETHNDVETWRMESYAESVVWI